MELRLLPLDEIERCRRQRQERGTLALLEHVQRHLVRRAVDAHARVLDHPLDRLLVAVLERAEGAPGEETAPHVLDVALDLALVLGVRGTHGETMKP
jgi:hypothetical protein